MTWVLIIMLTGWGAGVGSTGNAVSMMEFTTEKTCQNAAAAAINSYSKHIAYHSSDGITALCVQR